ncbi:MAG: hypothetical protein MUF45_14160 [Spirosomaceae bacterium]|jgi:hypothetical protein|nr:hypothetical protein [Spirosomataceae bacterium]
MTIEEQNIKNKIDDLSDLDLYLDDSQLWGRLEERLDEKKNTRRNAAWLWSMAASLLIGGLFYWVFIIKSSRSENITFHHQNIATKSTQTKAIHKPKDAVKYKPIQTQKEAQVVDNQLSIEESGEVLLGKRLTYKTENIEPKKSFDSVLITSKNINPTINFNTQNVTVLNLPIIPDEMMKREGFAKRLFRQIKNFNTEGKIDWRELNIEPRNVWAYLERNFRYDTTKTQTKKHSKL